MNPSPFSAQFEIELQSIKIGLNQNILVTSSSAGCSASSTTMSSISETLGISASAGGSSGGCALLFVCRAFCQRSPNGASGIMHKNFLGRTGENSNGFDQFRQLFADVLSSFEQLEFEAKIQIKYIFSQFSKPFYKLFDKNFELFKTLFKISNP